MKKIIVLICIIFLVGIVVAAMVFLFKSNCSKTNENVSKPNTHTLSNSSKILPYTPETAIARVNNTPIYKENLEYNKKMNACMLNMLEQFKDKYTDESYNRIKKQFTQNESELLQNVIRATVIEQVVANENITLQDDEREEIVSMANEAKKLTKQANDENYQMYQAAISLSGLTQEQYDQAAIESLMSTAKKNKLKKKKGMDDTAFNQFIDQKVKEADIEYLDSKYKP